MSTPERVMKAWREARTNYKRQRAVGLSLKQALAKKRRIKPVPLQWDGDQFPPSEASTPPETENIGATTVTENAMAYIGYGNSLTIAYSMRPAQAERLGGLKALISFKLLPGNKFAFMRGRKSPYFTKISLVSGKNKETPFVANFAVDLLPRAGRAGILPFKKAAPLEETWDDELEGYIYEIDWKLVIPPTERLDTVGAWQQTVDALGLKPGDHPQYTVRHKTPTRARTALVDVDENGGIMEVRRGDRFCRVSIYLNEDSIDYEVETNLTNTPRKGTMPNI